MRMDLMVSHEVPISMLEESSGYNDYDYALVHLFKNEDYFNYYRSALERGRKVIVDNSLFELGEAFSSEEFYNELMRLTDGLDYENIDLEYIIPDKWCNAEITINNLNEWIAEWQPKLPSTFKSISVMQGNSDPALMYCFRNMIGKVDKIALSFGYDHWKTGYSDNPDESSMLSRINFINYNYDELSLYPMHLLGCALPQEFKSYSNVRYGFIKTLDTSNPVIHGIHGVKYESWGLSSKIRIKMDDLMLNDYSNDKQIMDDIYFNIFMFKLFVCSTTCGVINYRYDIENLNNNNDMDLVFAKIDTIDELNNISDNLDIVIVCLYDGCGITKEMMDKFDKSNVSWKVMYVIDRDIESLHDIIVPAVVSYVPKVSKVRS